MERGHNYFDLSESEKRLFSSSPSHPCVFISHKKEDADFARNLSDYVMERGINVYFDENDPILAKEHKSPDEVVNAIKVVAKILNDYDDLDKYLASMKTTQNNSRISNDEILRSKQLLKRLDELKKVIPQLNK